VGGDLAVVRFQGEVPGIQEMDLRVRHIASKGFRTGRQEERIVLTPRQHRRTMCAQLLLELWVERNVGFIIQEQV
jgi:hypothetical protein